MTQPQAGQGNSIKQPGRAYIRISPDVIVRMLTANLLMIVDADGNDTCVSCDLPADAKAVRGWIGPRATIGDEGDICIMVESESIPQAPPGTMMQELPVTLRTHEPDPVTAHEVEF